MRLKQDWANTMGKYTEWLNEIANEVAVGSPPSRPQNNPKK
jgi:hypothetical protein